MMASPRLLSLLPRWRLPWPLPALLAWLAGWLAFLLLPRGPWALTGGVLAGAVLAAVWPGCTPWRRALLAAGFPLSLLGSGLAAGLPAWAWLLALALVLLAYPLRAWRDAPLFPTPPDALAGLERAVVLPAGARVLDAGCGLGHGLVALRRVWPEARLEGIEWSWPLRLAAGWRCRWARLQRGDMWRRRWDDYALVYLFQRPESMARAWAKAGAELRPGSWLVSLAFEVPGVTPTAVLRRPQAHPVWLYRIGGPAPAQCRIDPADIPPETPGPRAGRPHPT